MYTSLSVPQERTINTAYSILHTYNIIILTGLSLGFKVSKWVENDRNVLWAATIVSIK